MYPQAIHRLQENLTAARKGGMASSQFESGLYHKFMAFYGNIGWFMGLYGLIWMCLVCTTHGNIGWLVGLLWFKPNITMLPMY